MSRALTGIRPTGDLTVANYVGAMQPMAELQDTYEGPINCFVADMHALTDQEPGVINRTRLDTVRSYMAAGVDPERTLLYLQSQIGSQTNDLASLLDRHYTMAELLRIPTLKEKLKDGANESSATVALARYPILMAADILVQDATEVPVGKDQYPHIEVTRKLARRFNSEYGGGNDILVVPEALSAEGVRIASLNGLGKMSKSVPNGAIFLKDKPAEVAHKIKRAQTAEPGVMTEVLDSHFTLGDRLATNDDERAALAGMRARHLDGGRVMGEFKNALTDITCRFLGTFQERFVSISDAEVKKVLRDGGAQAAEIANGVMNRVHTSMNFVPNTFLNED